LSLGAGHAHLMCRAAALLLSNFKEQWKPSCFYSSLAESSC
jgi:hypothetical protein